LELDIVDASTGTQDLERLDLEKVKQLLIREAAQTLDLSFEHAVGFLRVHPIRVWH
jgi:hypothetical protein